MLGTREVTCLLGFDFGSKRIGVAVGQMVTHTATPLQTIKNKNGVPDWACISRLLVEWQADAIVVGMPLNMMGEEQQMSVAAARFMRQLRGRWELPVYSADERLSSFEARQRVKRNVDLDAVAAQVILETWFAENA